MASIVASFPNLKGGIELTARTAKTVLHRQGQYRPRIGFCLAGPRHFVLCSGYAIFFSARLARRQCPLHLVHGLHGTNDGGLAGPNDFRILPRAFMPPPVGPSAC